MSAREDAMKELTNGDLAAEMGWPVTWPEVRRLHGIIEALLAETEPEWEYAVEDYRRPGFALLGDTPIPDQVRREIYGERRHIRRRKAGPWEEVPE